jgi:hypothetical protein
MNAIDLLESQHREVEALFERIRGAKDPDEKLMLFQELSDNLAAHAAIEESIFYPAAYAKKTRELLTEAVEEHLSIKRILADLLEMTPDHENFDAKVKVLCEQVEHHVEEEEKELLPAAKKELGKERLEALGKEMKAAFEAEMKHEPSQAVPFETDEAAPLP